MCFILSAGDRKNSEFHHDHAKYYVPEHPSVIFNEQFFMNNNLKNELSVENEKEKQIVKLVNVEDMEINKKVNSKY